MPLTLTKAKALDIIHAAAEDTKRVIWTNHVLQQAKRRRISPTQILACLKHGVITEDPYWDNVHGTWPVTMERLTAGERLTVGLAINLKHRVIVITAF